MSNQSAGKAGILAAALLSAATLPLPGLNPIALALAPAADTSASLKAAIPKLDSHLQAQTSADKFSGAVLIAHDGKILFERGYGLADRETGERATPDTRFNLGSVDKFITRIAIFQLLEAGKLSLGDTLGKILPNYPNADARNKVTVQHLLDMSGGVPGYWNDKFRERREQLRSTDDFLALFADEPLRFEPGQYSEYSNGGYIVLGKIVEKLSGLSYADYVRRHITAPAGMKSTSLEPRRAGAKLHAIGYTRPNETSPLQSNAGMLPGWGSSAGGGYSTVRDFQRLDRALRTGKLLRPGTASLFFGEEFLRGEGPSAGWNGGTAGANTVFAMLPDGATIIIFANRDPGVAMEARDKLFEFWGRPLPPPRKRQPPFPRR
jgi:CubicO group peptidase (beta-lactamase class C family)